MNGSLCDKTSADRTIKVQVVAATTTNALISPPLLLLLSAVFDDGLVTSASGA